MSDSDVKNGTREGVSQFSDDWYRKLMDEASDAMLTGDPQRNWIDVNRTACAMFGYTRDEFLKFNLRDIVAPEELPISLALAEKAQPGETLRTERTMVRKDGSRFLVETSVKILEGGYALLILRDIAARKEAEKALQESLSLLTATLESTADGLLVVDREGRVASHNEKFRELWNIPPSIMQSGDDNVLIDYVLDQLQDPELFEAKIRELYSQPDAESYDVITFRDGRVVERYSRPRKIGGESVGRVWSFRDVTERRRAEREVRRLNEELEHLVMERTAQLRATNQELQNEITERKQAEAALRENEQRARLALYAARAGGWEYDLVNDEANWSREMFELYGLDPDSPAPSLQNFAELIHREDRERAKTEMETAAQHGGGFEIEFCAIRADGTEIWISSIGFVELGPDGRPTRARGIDQDITTRKRAEEERANLLESEQAARAEAEGAVRAREDLLSIVSHDLKQPLTVIKGYAQLLRHQLTRAATPDLGRVADGIEKIHSTTKRMEKQLDDLIDFARMQAGQPLTLKPAPVDLSSFIRRIADEFQQTTARHRVIVSGPHGEERLVGNWDEARLEGVVDNLLSNAVKYSPSGGDITVELSREERDGQSWAVLSVSDQGVGIPESDLPHIFEWYRRAGNVSDAVRGSGIGLSSARHIVEEHGGTISVQSREGEGSTFTVHLPL